MKRSVYIAGPYTGTKKEEHENMLKAAKVAAFYMRQGFFVFCPHTMTHHINRGFNADKDISYNDWLENDLYFLNKCDIVVFLSGWKNSLGARIEHIVAGALGKEIEYVREGSE